MELSVSWFYQDFGEPCADNFSATKWLNLNNPVRSAGTTQLLDQNPERVQLIYIEPFQGSGLDRLATTGETGGYSN